MKKIILSSLLFFAVNSVADGINPYLNDRFPGGYSLMSDSMPHLMGLYKKQGGIDKVNPTPEQETPIQKQFNKMAKETMQKATKIRELETKVVLAVVNDGKKYDEVKNEIETIAKLKTELVALEIETIDIFKSTLSKEQFNILLNMAKERAKR